MSVKNSLYSTNKSKEVSPDKKINESSSVNLFGQSSEHFQPYASKDNLRYKAEASIEQITELPLNLEETVKRVKRPQTAVIRKSYHGLKSISKDIIEEAAK